MNIELKDGLLIESQENSFKVKKKNLYIEDGVVKFNPNSQKIDRTINLNNKIIMPALTNGHHHIYSCLSKGIPAQTPFENFQGTLKNLWWRLDRALNKEDVRLSTVLTMQDCIKNGVTTVFDHHISADYIKNSQEIMAKIFEDFYIDGSIAFEISDRNGKVIFEKSLEQNIDFAQKSKNIKGLIGLHAAFTLSEQSLQIIAAKTKGIPIHMHIAEGDIDEEESRKKYRLSIIERLKKHNLLRENSILVHCSNLSDLEIKLLQNEDIFIVQAIDSNMNNALNVADINKFVKAKIKTTVGTDGMSSNILKSLKNSYLVTKFINKDPDIGFAEMNALLLNNYKLKLNYGFPLGIIENETADLVVFDYQPATKFDEDTFLAHFIFGITESRAQYVIKKDKILLDNYRLNIDKYGDLIKKAPVISKQLFQRFKKLD